MAVLSLHAVCLGERLRVRNVVGAVRIDAPVHLLTLPSGGSAFLFRYGVVVFAGVASDERESLLARVRPEVVAPFPQPLEDHLEVATDDADQVSDAGVRLRDLDPVRLAVVADVLAKSLVIDHYDGVVGEVFQQIEPVATDLERTGRAAGGARALRRSLGRCLRIEHGAVWRAQLPEKPALVWERADLDRLYELLAQEYELRDRDAALGRKLEVITRTTNTLAALLDQRSTLRLEALIVIVWISIDIALSWVATFR